MRLTKFVYAYMFGASLFTVSAPTVNSASIYGTTFDYRKVEPAIDQFPGKTPQQIAEYCKGKNLGTMETGTCAQFKFELVRKTLAKVVVANEKEISKNDVALRNNGNPVALPYFRQAQSHWQSYRDNQCYANVYEIGQASIRFADFWTCMETITKARIAELTRPDQTQ